eukprot:TRINITY_DN9101_c0_g1_i1.p1 TRINITY_DN9101_c0_g1~~TRINITY_DN9101_c0_g1_i1.p1  ORF type:complete len:153 (+),score=37.39 TRINITY_DN9101_c0_g1_i1:138-596(+)
MCIRDRSRAYDKVVALIAEQLGVEGLSVAEMADLMLENPVVVEEVLEEVRKNGSEYMWAWEETPHSIAHGVLDDETYDWYTIVRGMLSTGGYPVTVDDGDVIKAYELGHSTMKVNVCHTGACGFGGLLQQAGAGALAAGGSNVVVFTGQVRA